MFLSNSTLGDVIKAQVSFKMKAYTGAVVSLILIQLVGLFFSMNGSSSMGSSINNTSIQVTLLSNDIVFAFVAVWALFVGYLITTKAYRYDDFSFVATRLSSNLANIIIICLMSIFAAITTFLSNYLLRVILLLLNKVDYMKSPGIFDDPLQSIQNIIVIMLLILTIAAGGYLGGMLVQISKVFIFFIPIFLLAIPITRFGQTVIQYIFVNNLFLIVKLICIPFIFFALAIVCSNRLGVRK
ncbi:hypothetical protein ACFVR1_13350 [Psychrobacillus sp. NPDC058041]|uniref:hypothetical protein n=1 Tax=Psychrobacillus sp. NPDC058041 TaxID=3346310 RepID=UPI0036D966BC